MRIIVAERRSRAILPARSAPRPAWRGEAAGRQAAGEGSGAATATRTPHPGPLPASGERGSDRAGRVDRDYEQPLVVPQLTHLWQLPLGIMIDPHSGQVGASVRAMKL